MSKNRSLDELRAEIGKQHCKIGVLEVDNRGLRKEWEGMKWKEDATDSDVASVDSQDSDVGIEDGDVADVPRDLNETDLPGIAGAVEKDGDGAFTDFSAQTSNFRTLSFKSGTSATFLARNASRQNLPALEELTVNLKE
ncbi:hypothetical protein BLS_004078 [Venturia inaequalis]|nr:hypothetical protein BLS_004078 [Venturia inaequalis]KAE9988399.1 hypothetical protein EG328_011159 [Venturia inaequalis]